MSDTYAKNYDRLAKIAQDNNLVLNPDPERVKKVVGLMANNYDLVREWVCPCKQQNKPAIKGSNTTCPCPEWLDEVVEEGPCFCRLFFTEKKAPEMAFLIAQS